MSYSGKLLIVEFWFVLVARLVAIAKMAKEENRRRKRSYDMAFKFKVIACAKRESNRGAALIQMKANINESYK